MSMNQDFTGLSARGEVFREVGKERDHYDEIWGNSYHPDRNPAGVINLGTSENYVMLQDVADYINKNVGRLDDCSLSALTH
jgi:hypothetical protein